MHIEPLIDKLKKSWTLRIILYISTNLILALIIKIWTLKLWQIALIIPFMAVYIIVYENLCIMFDRLKNNENAKKTQGEEKK